MAQSHNVATLPISGEPIDERIVGFGPVVMRSAAETNEVNDDSNSGKLGRIAA